VRSIIDNSRAAAPPSELDRAIPSPLLRRVAKFATSELNSTECGPSMAAASRANPRDRSFRALGSRYVERNDEEALADRPISGCVLVRFETTASTGLQALRLRLAAADAFMSMLLPRLRFASSGARLESKQTQIYNCRTAIRFRAGRIVIWRTP
jgi:hypothetical protein